MKSNELIEQAKAMIEFCKWERTCKGCAGNIHIEYIGGSICNVSGYCDNEFQMTVDHILEAITNKRRDDD